tara:strand:+ start:10368 stop:12131 length:1764 start_codon:yes stop_codon:yes gene_type:complete
VKALFSNNNILTLIKRQPKYLLVVFIKTLRGFLFRKNGYYGEYGISNDLIDQIKNINTLIFSIDLNDNRNWYAEFAIKAQKKHKWDFGRHDHLEKIFEELIDVGEMPVNPIDKEDYWSAVQVNWLFFNVRSGKTNEINTQFILNANCQFLLKNKNHWIYRPFTISEVISNLIKIKLYFGDSLIFSNNIKRFLNESVLFLLQHLEVYKNSSKNSLNHTNNHVLSNVRALFWATKIYSNSQIEDIAEYIFKEYCLPLFDDGILDEGSTVYHFIAAQCIRDISYFISYEELPRVDKIINELDKYGFLEPSTFPVIGDVSPDPSLCSVMDDAMEITKKMGQESHFLVKSQNSKSLCSQNIGDYGLHNYGNWKWIVHARDSSKHIQHSHNDYGSPVLIYKNTTIICDLGRPSYMNMEEAKNYASTKYHSVPQISGLDQNPRAIRDIYPKHFLVPNITNSVPFDSKLLENCDKPYEFVCGGRYLLYPNYLYGGFWVRNFICNSDDQQEIIIEDLVNLNKKSYVHFRFFMPSFFSKSAMVDCEYRLNGISIFPSEKKILRNISYGQTAEAYEAKIFSEPSVMHHLTTKLRIVNE